MVLTHLHFSESFSKHRKKGAGFLANVQDPSNHTKDETLARKDVDTKVENRDCVCQNEIPVRLPA